MITDCGGQASSRECPGYAGFGRGAMACEGPCPGMPGQVWRPTHGGGWEFFWGQRGAPLGPAPQACPHLEARGRRHTARSHHIAGMTLAMWLTWEHTCHMAAFRSLHWYVFMIACFCYQQAHAFHRLKERGFAKQLLLWYTKAVRLAVDLRVSIEKLQAEVDLLSSAEQVQPANSY